MKVIGKISSDKYICEVSHRELEKFLNKFYGKLDRLDIGDQIDLERGYDFADDIVLQFRKTQEFIKAHEKVINAILSGVSALDFMVNPEIEEALK